MSVVLNSVAPSWASLRKVLACAVGVAWIALGAPASQSVATPFEPEVRLEVRESRDAVLHPSREPSPSPSARRGRLDPEWLAIGSGTAALVNGTALLAQYGSQSNAEITGWSLGAIGAAAVGGGVLEMLRPELLPFHLRARSSRGGGMLFLSGRF